MPPDVALRDIDEEGRVCELQGEYSEESAAGDDTEIHNVPAPLRAISNMKEQ